MEKKILNLILIKLLNPAKGCQGTVFIARGCDVMEIFNHAK